MPPVASNTQEGPPKDKDPVFGQRYLARVIGLYVLFSSLWIFVSDELLNRFIPNPELQFRFAIAKGWLFIAITTTLLYRLIRRFFLALQAQHLAQIRSAYELAENIPAGIYALLLRPGETMAHFTYVSPRFLELTGLTRAELERDPDSPFTRLHPDDLDAWMKKNLDTFARKQPFQGEARLLIDGQVRWISAESNPRTLPDGSTFWEGVIIDITSRKRAETQIGLEQQSYRLLADNVSDNIWTSDLQGRFTYLSPSIETLLGYTVDEAMALSHLDFLTPEERAREVARMQTMQNSVEADGSIAFNGQITEHECLRKDGRRIWVEVSVNTLTNPEGEVIGLSGITRDITARKRAEQQVLELNATLEQRVQERTEALKRTTERLELALQATRDGLWDWNLATDQAKVSESYWEMLGHTDKPLEGSIETLWLELLHPDDRDRVLAEARSSLHVGGHRSMEFRLRAGDGSYRWVLWRGQAVDRDFLGRPLRAIGTHVDITERHILEERIRAVNTSLEQKVEERTMELARTNAAKSLFLAHMSHEIRTPMSGILGMTELALHDQSKEKLRHYLEGIQVSAQSLLEILNDILDFSKIEAGKVHIERAPVAVRRLMEQLRVLMEPSASAKRLGLSVAVEADVDPYVLGDSLRLRQVLANLLGNAIKFTESGTVVLRVSRAGPDRLRFAVIDTGIGLTPEQCQGLFEAFSQADVSITRRYGGTGLGLAISQQLVTLMGGRIEVDSEAGRGSCFSFEIVAKPCAARPESAVIPRPDADQLATLAGRRVLLVEDDPINREFVQTILERYGVRVALAGNGREAFEHCQAVLPELILMDIQMPIMDGYEASRRIRALDGRIPIVALSAHAYEEDVRQSLAAGMNEHVSKPVNTDRLLGLLVKYLSAGNSIVSLVEVPASQAGLEESDWPLIEGIDRDHARRTMDGDGPLFLRLLRVFVEQYRGVVEQTQQALASGQHQEAARLMHSLKGAAGQIGALELRDATKQAEKALKECEPDAETQVLAVAVPLERLLKSVQVSLVEIEQVSQLMFNVCKPRAYDN